MCHTKKMVGSNTHRNEGRKQHYPGQEPCHYEDAASNLNAYHCPQRHLRSKTKDRGECICQNISLTDLADTELQEHYAYEKPEEESTEMGIAVSGCSHIYLFRESEYFLSVHLEFWIG